MGRPALRYIRRALRVLGVAALVLAIAALVAMNVVDFGASPATIERAFAGLPHAPRHGAVEVDGRAIHYVEVGDPENPPVVLLHGSPGSWDAYLSQLTSAALQERAHMIALDRPGFGDSSDGGHEPSLARQAAITRAVLHAAHPDAPAVVVGHSFGGPVAGRLAMDAPEDVRALVLVAPSIDPALERTMLAQRVANLRVVAALLPDALVACNREIMALRAELEEMAPRWERMTTPVTVIQGEADRLVPPANADFAAARVPASSLELVRVPGMDHFVPWTRPELIEDAVLRHLGA
ncbi:MAG: alpha/beta fold hydrolase [Myxococcales bacterium]|nr:alpha/beta fold hydrolase [Myxococcales bacterium]MCB9756305.1 alpha/beta fold hydrolase [Myxococcales bacterium]